MTKTNYAHKNLDNHTAKAYGKNLGISTKVAINIAKKLRGMNADKAVAYLDRVANLEQAVPYTRFTDGVGHRKGPMASGRFPVKAATEINMVLKSAIANATNLNLSEELVIENIIANKAGNRFHFGRQRRRAMKQTHIEIVLREVEGKLKATKKSVTQKADEQDVTKEVKAPKAENKFVKEKPTKSVTDKQPVDNEVSK